MVLLSPHRSFHWPWFRVFGLSQAPAASTHHRLAYSQFPMSFFSIHVHFRFFCCPACNLVSLVFHCSIYHFIFCFKWTTDCYFFDGTIAIFILSSVTKSRYLPEKHTYPKCFDWLLDAILFRMPLTGLSFELTCIKCHFMCYCFESFE